MESHETCGNVTASMESHGEMWWKQGSFHGVPWIACGNVATSMESHGEVWWKRGNLHGVPWRGVVETWQLPWSPMDSSVLDAEFGGVTRQLATDCSGMHRLTVSRQLATYAVVRIVSQCHDSWYWNALDSRSSEVSVLISGRLRRMVSEVFGKHFGVVYSWSTMSSSFVSCLAWCCIVESQRILSQFMHLHGSRHKILVRFARLSRLLLRPVSSPCHPCPLDAHATLTGIDYARDRLLGISI